MYTIKQLFSILEVSEHMKKKEKEVYEPIQMEVIEFEVEDVITTSGGNKLPYEPVSP